MQKNESFLEELYWEDLLLAIIIKSEYKDQGIKFFTPNNLSQQLGYMNRQKGYLIEPHIHNHVVRSVEYTQETLFIKSGKLKVNFYDKDQNYLESRILNKGDIILLAFGGHGFEMLEDTEIIEIKQGPYAGQADKKRFKKN